MNLEAKKVLSFLTNLNSTVFFVTVFTAIGVSAVIAWFIRWLLVRNNEPDSRIRDSGSEDEVLNLSKNSHPTQVGTASNKTMMASSYLSTEMLEKEKVIPFKAMKEAEEQTTEWQSPVEENLNNTRGDRIVRSGHNNFPGVDIKYKVKQPVIEATGRKSSLWTNFLDICQQLDRKPDHVSSFIFSELKTKGTRAGSKLDQLVINTIVQQEQLADLLKVYGNKYVLCSFCSSSNTTLRKISLGHGRIRCNRCYQSTPVELPKNYHNLQ